MTQSHLGEAVPLWLLGRAQAAFLCESDEGKDFSTVGLLVVRKLVRTTLDTEPCPACGHAGHVEISLYQRYGAVVTRWLPLFGMGVTTGAACTLCGQVVKDPFLNNKTFLVKKMALSGTLQAALAGLKGSYRRTAWQRLYPWSLTIVLAVVVAVWVGVEVHASIAVKNRDAQAREYVMDPRVGDIYKVRWMADDGPSSGRLLKVVSIDGDTMTLLRSTNSTDDFYNPDAWAALEHGADPFGGGEYTVSLSHLQEQGYRGYGEFYGLEGLEGKPWQHLYADLLEGYDGIDNIVERTEK